MNHIKLPACPDCGAGVKSEVRRDQHTNGYWNETVMFVCGATHHFSPNFMRADVTTGCPFTPERSTRDEKRGATLAAVRRMIENSGADDAFRRLLLDKLQYVTVDG